MIAIPLYRLVAEEPGHGWSAIVVSMRMAREGDSPIRQCRDAFFLPALALAVVEWHDDSSTIIPLEHVGHMNVEQGIGVMQQLEKVIP